MFNIDQPGAGVIQKKKTSRRRQPSHVVPPPIPGHDDYARPATDVSDQKDAYELQRARSPIVTPLYTEDSYVGTSHQLATENALIDKSFNNKSPSNRFSQRQPLPAFANDESADLGKRGLIEPRQDGQRSKDNRLKADQHLVLKPEGKAMD